MFVRGGRVWPLLNEAGRAGALASSARPCGWGATAGRPTASSSTPFGPRPGSVRAFPPIEYALSEAGLTVPTTATNVGNEACPFGSGSIRT